MKKIVYTILLSCITSCSLAQFVIVEPQLGSEKFVNEYMEKLYDRLQTMTDKENFTKNYANVKTELLELEYGTVPKKYSEEVFFKKREEAFQKHWAVSSSTPSLLQIIYIRFFLDGINDLFGKNSFKSFESAQRFFARNKNTQLFQNTYNVLYFIYNNIALPYAKENNIAVTATFDFSHPVKLPKKPLFAQNTLGRTFWKQEKNPQQRVNFTFE